MPEKPSNMTTAAHQTELAVHQLISLSTLPCVAVRLLPKLLQSQFSASAHAEIIESDPALTAKICSIAHEQGINLSEQNSSLRQVLGRLPAHLVRNALFSIKILGCFGSENSSDRQRTPLKKELTVHSLAVACCAKNIAEIASPQMNPQLVYSAGLLHDIGKLALEEVMPKSFDRIVEEAKSQKICSCAIEEKYLCTDHTIIGKQLAQKWHLPKQIIFAIWLHHSNTALISPKIPEAKIAQIIQLADSIARQSGIGQSGSYDLPDLPEQITRSLGINTEQLEQIRQSLPEAVEQKSEVLGLETPTSAASYYDAIHTAAARLAQENTKLSVENQELQTASSHFDFIIDFLSSINSTDLPIEIAENFAVRWQKFYQTGQVCLYLTPPGGSETFEAVVVENLSQSKIVSLNIPSELPPIPQAIPNNFVILDAHDYIDWLFEQLDIDFDPTQTKLIPLLSGGRAIGAIGFELRYPADSELFRKQFEQLTCTAGLILEMALVSVDQRHFAERFVQLLTNLKETQSPTGKIDSLAAVIEMAAGAAHELNNPLSVISGRAQLLAETETDPEKKRILKQIKQNANELSGITEGLMSFTKPQQPRPTRTNIKQVLDEAVQLTSQKTNKQHDIQIEVTNGIENVFVDSAQIASAIANVLSNALESYPSSTGPIKVAAAVDERDGFVKLKITDFGCGMNQTTLQKATLPFFCAKPAGRKRGMGLAYTNRLIELNNGSLKIESQPGSGTTVTIYLPCK